jgi:hypothetical protein
MANATLSALISEFQQYGDTPFIGADAVKRLRDVVVSLTGGVVNPPLDSLGNNHTYWLAVTIDYMNNNPGSKPQPSFLAESINPVSGIITFFPNRSGWNIYDVTSQDPPSLVGPASGTFDVSNKEIIIATTQENANAWWDLGDGSWSCSIVDIQINRQAEVLNIVAGVAGVARSFTILQGVTSNFTDVLVKGSDSVFSRPFVIW